MPCRNADHNHEWPSTGDLTIFACETICYLYDSTKEYKPASALRKHVQTHIKNDKLPLSLLRSASGRPKLSTRGLTLHRKTAVVQSPTAGHEPQDSSSTQTLSAQRVVQGSPCESHRALPHSPALPPTTAASSIAYNSMLRVQQSSSAGASEIDALLNMPGFSPVEKRTTPTEATHDYSETYSSDASTLSYPRSSSPSNDPLHSSPSLGAVHPRIGRDYMKVGLRKVPQEHLASITPTIDSVQNTVSDDRTVATSYEIPLSTQYLGGSHLHHKTCWRCSMLSLECRLIEQEKTCDECDYCGTALLCFGFRLEHLVDQVLNFIGEFPRILRWKVGSNSRHFIISFSDRQKPPPLDTIYILEMMKADPWHYSWFFHNGWVKAFYNVVDAANQYRNTKSREDTIIGKGLGCLAICVEMLWKIVYDLMRGDPRAHTAQCLNKSALTDFLSTLFDTTIAKPSSERKEQLLDVFYGTLIVCMIRFVLNSAVRCSLWGYEPLGLQMDHDPTFLDGSRSQLYQPMLHLLDYSMSTFQGGDAHYLSAAAAVNPSTFGPLAPPQLTSMSLCSHARCFINYFSQQFQTSQSDPPHP